MLYYSEQPLDRKFWDGTFAILPRSLTTYQTSNLEYENADQIGCFDRKVLEGFAPHGLGGCHSKKQSRGIPAYLIEAMEFIGDMRDSGGNNRLMRGHESILWRNIIHIIL